MQTATELCVSDSELSCQLFSGTEVGVIVGQGLGCQNVMARLAGKRYATK